MLVSRDPHLTCVSIRCKPYHVLRQEKSSKKRKKRTVPTQAAHGPLDPQHADSEKQQFLRFRIVSPNRRKRFESCSALGRGSSGVLRMCKLPAATMAKTDSLGSRGISKESTKTTMHTAKRLVVHGCTTGALRLQRLRGRCMSL